jgi:hypothetical protein
MSRLRQTLHAALRGPLRRLGGQVLQGWSLSADDLLHHRDQLWGGGSPLGVWGRWRTRLAHEVAADRFERHGLDNVFERYPGKQDRQIFVVQCLHNVITGRVPGVVAELGCYRGHTAVQLLEVLRARKDEARLLLFDSFQGMPESAHPGDRHWRAGDMAAGLQEVRERFRAFPQVEIVPGFFSQTLPAFPDLRVKLAHVDADLYSSIKEVDGWLLDRVEPGGMVVYDDYGFPTCEGAQQAVDEDLAGRDDYVKLSLPTGQYLAMRR